MRKILALIAVVFCFSVSAFAQREITIEQECVYLDELTQSSVIPHSKVTCGIMPGEAKSFPKEVIENYLHRAGINARVAQSVVVRRVGEKISASDIEKAVVDAYKKAYPEVSVKVEQIRFPKEIFAEKMSDFSIKVDTAKFGSNYVEVNNGLKKTQVYMFIKAYQKGFIAVERIKIGESIASKVREDMVDITMSRGSILKDVNGVVAAKTISKGKAITTDLASERPALAKGDPVVLVYDNGVIKIETTGIAETSAFVGKTVQVRNTSSQKIIAAEYVGNGVAKALL